jgi:Ni,Fe-hydrogenase III large subunit
MNDISLVEFGKLINAVETLTVEVESLREEVSTMKENMTGYRGVAVGIMLAAGGVGASASHIIEKLMR